jgi:hypothetical protein
MAHSLAMWSHGVAALWNAAYRRSVRSAFATVPLYRERWALDGREDPVVVPGKTGHDGGAISAEEVARKLVDLVPLAGGATELDACRGLGAVLRYARPPDPGTVVVVLDPAIRLPPVDLPRGVRGSLLDADSLSAAALGELTSTLRRNGKVLAVGPDKYLGLLATALPDELAARLVTVPQRELDGLDGGPFGVLHDPALGYLGGFGACGRWHLDWRNVFARSTSAGLAFTLLAQRSPRLVDVLIAGGVRGRVEPCPRHGTPVVLT